MESAVPLSDKQATNTHKSHHEIPSVFFRIFAFSYSGALRHHTIEPVQDIQHNQNYREDKDGVIAALARFRQTKSEELRFVQGAATISGAAAIGVFSWPSIERTVWVAKMFWDWSLFMSFFALISSAHQRLLRCLPAHPSDFLSDGDVVRCLSLFLQPPVAQGDKMFSRTISARMLWFWQCPTMLMSFSWVFFLVGYTLHILTPIFDASQAEFTRTPAIVTVCGCALVVGNFFFCAKLCQRRLSKAAHAVEDTTPERAPV